MSRILVVEDEQHIAEGLRFNLEAEGHERDRRRRRRAGAELMLDDDREQFDAVILDVMLPGKDGFAVATELRAAASTCRS